MVLLENYLVQTSQPLKSSKPRDKKLFGKYDLNITINILQPSFDSNIFSFCQFGLPRAEKELFEREERAEIQQEILKKVARNLPVYTRTAGGGETCFTVVTVAPSNVGRRQMHFLFVQFMFFTHIHNMK